MVDQQETIIKLLTVLFPESKIYLFGSRARGTERPESDIDIAIDNGARIPFLELAKARNIIEALYIPQKIDIVDVTAVPQEMRDIILREGIVWKNYEDIL